ncbi:hypothetical protein LTR65_006356 [Meristemomyces frigidus]
MEGDAKESPDANDGRDKAQDVEKQQLPDGSGGFHGQRRASKQDKADPFGDESDAEVKYRTMAWWQAAMIMLAETISLGILSLPSVLASIGLVASIILIAGLGLTATYTGYTIWQFKMAYPHVHNLADVGEVLLGPFGREFFGAAQTIFLVFTMGSHLLTFTIAMNAITAFISIFSAVMITMVGVGIEQPDPVVHATVKTGFATAFASVTNIVFAYAGHVAFFTFISELKDPRDFPKALYVLQVCDTTMYIVVAIVVYRYAGTDVASPALGSTGSVVKKVAYGIALPTGVLWLYINQGHWFSNGRKTVLTVANFLIFCLGAAICGIGLYASGVQIKADSGSGGSWSCADNQSGG